MEIISPRHTEVSVSFTLNYDLHGPGWGYGFPCTEDGKVLEDELQPAGREGLTECRASNVKPYIRRYENHYRCPAVGLCEDCGNEVSLDSNTNTCSRCGVDYNMSGQRLAARCFWGEETGETWMECL